MNPSFASICDEESCELLELVVTDAASSQVIVLEEGRAYTIGRGSDCDICVQDAAASRLHAHLELTEGCVVVEDLGARNPTSVGGRALRAGERIRLVAGAVLLIGSTPILIRNSQPPASTPLRLASAPTLPPPSVEDEPSHIETRESGSPTVDGPVLVDPAMRRVYATLDALAPTPINVLVRGETGVGKDVFAHELHRRSDRASGPFVQLNCAALPATLLESELFGYERGAFSGAVGSKVGLVEAAHGGTLFLDEIGEMPLETQAKLLLFLESGLVLRVGSVKPRSVDVRVVSATHTDPERAIQRGTFRADLFFRLNGISVTLPPLRARPLDIAPLAAHFARKFAARLGRRAPRLSPAALAKLEAWSWPGNARELRNVIDRAIVLSRGSEIEADDVLLVSLESPEEGFTSGAMTAELPAVSSSFPYEPSSERPSVRDLPTEIREIERARIVDALSACAGNQSQAAKMLGVSRSMLVKRIVEFGLTRPRKR